MSLTNHAEVCPVCMGKGKVPAKDDFTTSAWEKICHGCLGKGWVVVPDPELINGNASGTGVPS